LHGGAQDRGSGAMLAATPRADPSCMPPLKVFIVEDSPVIRQNLVGALEEMAPVKVVGHAEGAAAAKALLSAAPPPCDLAIVDIFLRDGTGLDVLRALREQHSPVTRVVLTNYATPDIRSQCLALGADRVFDKSGDIDALVDYCIGLAPKPPGSGAA
jgi:DNA-binding NarL/FixJ family response regulator